MSSLNGFFSNLLKTNHDKTIVLLIGFPDVVANYKTLALTLNLCGSIITYPELVKNLGIIFNSSFFFHWVCESHTYFLLTNLVIFIAISQEQAPKPLSTHLTLFALIAATLFLLYFKPLLSALPSLYKIMPTVFYIPVINFLV